MDTMFQIAALAVITAVSCLVVRSRAGDLSLLISLAGLVLIVLTAMYLLSPVLDVFSSLETLSGMSDEVTSSMLKVAGIGLLTQVTSSVCEDAGEKTLCTAVEISGRILSLYAGLPLLSAVISLLEETLR